MQTIYLRQYFINLAARYKLDGTRETDVESKEREERTKLKKTTQYKICNDRNSIRNSKWTSVFVSLKG